MTKKAAARRPFAKRLHLGNRGDIARGALLAFALGAALALGAEAQRLPLDRIKLPPGFNISVFAHNVPNARSMTWGAKGTLFIGTRSAGKVYAVRHKDGKASEIFTLATGLNMPNGVAFRDGALYVAEVDRILRYDGVESRLESPPAPVVVTDKYPDEGHHGWKFIRFGPDGWLYAPVGAPCNPGTGRKDRPSHQARRGLGRQSG